MEKILIRNAHIKTMAGPVQTVVTPPRRALPNASSIGLMESIARSCGVSGSTISL